MKMFGRTDVVSRRWVGVTLLLAGVLLFAGGCGNPLNLVGLIDGPDGTALSVIPGSGTISANRQIELVASGGYPPYAFELVSGVGTLTDSTYQAPPSTGSATLRVTDGVGTSVEVVFAIDASGVPLGISPSTQTVYHGNSLVFSAVGGTGPYTFSFATAGDNESGAILNSSTGDYTAGESAGTDTVTITDTSDGATATATVTVLERSLAISPSASAATSSPPTNTITFQPVGGTGPFEFAFAGGGDNQSGATLNLTTGAYVAGLTSGTDTITLTDTYDGRTVSATVNVTAGTFVPDVDYSVGPIVGPSSTSTRFGGAFTASTSVTNVGGVGGGANLLWTAYASPDGAINGTDDMIVDSGTIAGGVDASLTEPISIAGNWPSIEANYFLIVQVAASDEVPGPENTRSSGGQTLVHRPVTITPASESVFTGDAVSFTADGVVGTASWDIVTSASGAGDPTSGGLYTAGSSAGVDTVRVTDDFDSSVATATVNVLARSFSVSPTSATATTGSPTNAITFQPVGGTGPFEFAFAVGGDNQSGATLNLTTGAYVAGSAAGTDTITVTDTYDGRTVIATVNVVDATLVENVNYVADPITNVVGATYSGDPFTADGTIQNTGSAAGASAVTWTAYASPDTTIGGSTDVVVDSGSFAALGSGASQGITIGGNWPAIQDSYYLLLEVQATDELASADNVSATASQFYVTTPVAISPTTFTLYTGQTLQFSAEGEGTGFAWDVPTNVSGGSIDAAGLYVAGGTPGTDQVRVTDTFDGSEAFATVTVQPTPLPDAVNYVIDEITVTSSGTSAGDPLTGTIVILNGTTGTGSQTISWNLYASRNDTVLGSGDALVASGTTAALGPGGSVNVGFSDFWPTTAGDYYLIATIAAADETNTTGNQAATTGTTTIAGPPPADVDYEVSVVPAGGSVTAGSSISESFTVQNTGSAAGGAVVSWDVYLSQDQLYGAGDTFVDNGSFAGLGSLASSGPIAISGTWPAPGDPWPYYLIVRLSAGDDVDAANNTSASPVYNKIVSGVLDYSVTDITTTHPVELAGAPIRESFTVTNIGATSGGAGDTFDWVAYASADAVLDAGEVVDSGVGVPELTAGTSVTIPINGLWPGTPGTYDLYVDIVPPGTDADAANDLRSEGPFTLEGSPDYAVDLSGIVPTQDGTPGGALNLDASGTFTFVITNTSAYDGREPLVWRAYASTDSSLDGSDALLASDTLSPLLATDSTPPIDLGPEPWPGFGAVYRIIVTVSADDDEQTANNVATAAPLPVPWTYVEGAEPNDDLSSPPVVPNLNTYGGPSPDPGGTLEPGELYKVIGFGEDDGNPPIATADAYQLTVDPTVNTLAVRAVWSVLPADDYIDFVVESQAVLAPVFSIGVDTFREPDGGSWFNVTGWGADTFVYVTVSFLVDMLSTDGYSLYILGQP